MDSVSAPIPPLRIVIVEDDNTVRSWFKTILEKQLNHQVIGEAETGSAMVETVLQVQPDLVLFDIHLPGINGLDALAQIYQQHVVAAVAITGDRDQELLTRALDEHVLAYLLKPIEAHQLGPALRIAWKQYEQLRELADENTTLKQSLNNRKVIERAKGLLMRKYRWAEPEAFRKLQKTAMNRRTTMALLAQAIINGEEVALDDSKM